MRMNSVPDTLQALNGSLLDEYDELIQCFILFCLDELLELIVNTAGERLFPNENFKHPQRRRSFE